MNKILHRSGAWCLLLGFEVLDPDGWDRTNFQESWNEPITRDEFMRRVSKSTARRLGDVTL